MLSSAIRVSVSPSRPRLAASLVIRIVNALLSSIGVDEVGDRLLELLGRSGHVGQIPLLALLAGEQLAREQQLLRLAQADVAREAVDRAGAAEQRAADVEVADLGVVGGDEEVAGDHQLEAAGDRVALDDGDRRLPEVEGAGERAGRDLRDLHRLVRRAQELGVEHVEVGAGAEGVAAAADDDDARVLVLLGAVEHLAEAHQQLPVDAVLDLGRFSQIVATPLSTSYWMTSVATWPLVSCCTLMPRSSIL